MNKLQLIASAISGYEGLDCPWSSAQDDFYYDECDTLQKKLNHIIGYSDAVYDISLTVEEAKKIQQFLDVEIGETHTLFDAFEELKGFVLLNEDTEKKQE